MWDQNTYGKVKKRSVQKIFFLTSKAVIDFFFMKQKSKQDYISLAPTFVARTQNFYFSTYK